MRNLIINGSVTFCLLFFPLVSFGGTTLFQENFADTNFSARGWYDGSYTASSITTSTGVVSGAPYPSAFECHFLKGATACAGGDLKRMLFTPSNSLYISYWIKLSSNWVGSGVSYHPHIINFITNANGPYDGLASTHLTGYMEVNGNDVRFQLQDGQNINMSNLNVNLCPGQRGTTESRANFGCNGICNSDTWDYPADCYNLSGTTWTNDVAISSVSLSLNAWHHIEGYFQMNTISGGIGQNNGIMQGWVDGKQVLNYTDLIYRTNQYPTMQWNQFIVAPYMAPTSGTGSPVDQTFWIDDLTVATSRPTSTTSTPSPPSSLRVQ